MDEMDQMLVETTRLLDELVSDYSVPRNIRKNIQVTRNKLVQSKTSMDVKAASSISFLDDLVNDPNMPGHARTIIYTIMSKLEVLQKKASIKS